ncbi:MAG: 50S ribosomal protein L25 [Planctomycetota bacterium]
MEFIQIEVSLREERGTRAMGRLRRDDVVPAVLYGLGRRNLPISIPSSELQRFLRTGSHLVELRMGGETREAILREIQIHPVTDEILHLDFIRVEKGAEVEDEVPIVFKGHAKGASEGGLFQPLMDHLRVKARPRDIPKEIVLDIRDLAVGDEIHVRDIDLPEGAKAVPAADEMVAHVVLLRGLSTDEEEEEEAAEAVGPSSTEPELIGKAEGEGA